MVMTEFNKKSMEKMNLRFFFFNANKNEKYVFSDNVNVRFLKANKNGQKNGR